MLIPSRSANVEHLYVDSGIPTLIDSLREQLSSVTAVSLTLLFLEGGALSRGLLWGYVTSDATPLISLFGFNVPQIHLPDLFQLLTEEFWITTALWCATSWVVPGIFAYFYNLSTHIVRRGGTRVSEMRYPFDPLVFHVVKAIATLVVHQNLYTFGLVDSFYVHKINTSIFGGAQAMMVGSIVGIIVSLYEATQRK